MVPVIVGILRSVSILFPLIIVLGVLLASFCFSALGALISAFPTNLHANVMMFSTLINFPIIFISGIFIPVKRLPLWGKILAIISLLTYFIDLMRHSIQQGNYYPISIDFLALFVLALIFLALAIKLREKETPERI